MKLPTITVGLTGVLDRSEAQYMAADMEVLRTKSDNPLGVEVSQFGNATALAMKSVDNWEFNRVLGLRNQTEAEIDTILRWYLELDAQCHFEVVPKACSKNVSTILEKRGFYPSGFHTVLYGIPNPTAQISNSKIEAREILPGEMPIFSDLYMHYMGNLNIPERLIEQARINVLNQHPLPGWRLYIATIDGIPAAFAELCVNASIGSLAGAATLPQFRRQGCQTALLLRRIEDAYADGCDLVVGQATPGSGSQRNMERVGLTTAYMKAIWSRSTSTTQ